MLILEKVVQIGTLSTKTTTKLVVLKAAVIVFKDNFQHLKISGIIKDKKLLVSQVNLLSSGSDKKK